MKGHDRVTQPGLSVVLDGWTAPESVKLDGSTLRYDLATSRTVLPGPAADLLSRFVALAEGDGDAIRDVAQGWGPLAPDQEPLSVETESVDEWRRWARRVNAVLGFAGALHKGKIPDADDRRVLMEWDEKPSWPVNKNSPEYRDAIRDWRSNVELGLVDADREWLADVQAGQVAAWIADSRTGHPDVPSWAVPSWADSRNLAYFVNGLLARGRVVPEVQWFERGRLSDAPSFSLRTRSLFGAVALTVASRTANASVPSLCADCGVRFVSPGRRGYCDECATPQAKSRRSSRRHRARQGRRTG